MSSDKLIQYSWCFIDEKEEREGEEAGSRRKENSATSTHGKNTM